MRKIHTHSRKYEKFIKSLLIFPSLNLGCGNFKIGDVNVDIDKRCNPDVAWDLNKFPYPFRERVQKYFVASLARAFNKSR